MYSVHLYSVRAATWHFVAILISSICKKNSGYDFCPWLSSQFFEKSFLLTHTYNTTKEISSLDITSYQTINNSPSVYQYLILTSRLVISPRVLIVIKNNYLFKFLKKRIICFPLRVTFKPLAIRL